MTKTSLQVPTYTITQTQVKNLNGKRKSSAAHIVSSLGTVIQ